MRRAARWTPALLLLGLLPAQAQSLLEAEVARPGAAAPSAPLLPVQVASFGAARAGDWVYVYSGHTGPTHAHSLDNLSPHFVRLNLQAPGQWEQLPCPVRLQSVALVDHGDAVIRIGGMTARNRSGKREALHSVATVARYDPLKRAWTDLPPLPEPRSSHDAVRIGDTLYVVGGWTLAGERQVWLDTAWSLDLKAKQAAWQALPKPPFSARRALALAEADGKLLVLGGMTWEGEFTSEVHRYDPAKRAWSQLPKLPLPGFGVAARSLGRDVYASGLDSDVYRLGLHGGEPSWEKVGSLMFPRYFHRFVPLGKQRLLALGGVTRPQKTPLNVHVRTTEVFDATPERGPRLTAWTLPYPGRAKNRQGVLLFHDSLWLFGGNDSVRQHDFGPKNFLREGYRLHLATHRFARLPDFPAARQSMRTLVVRPPATGKRKPLPRGLLVGGFGHTGKGTRSFAEVRVFDFKTKEFPATKLALPSPRTQFILAQRGEQVFAFGGLDYDSRRAKGKSFSFPTDVLAADLRKPGPFAPTGITLPQPRRAFGGALLGDRFYLAGGMKAGFELIKDVDVYDFAQQTWSTIPAPKDPRISPHLLALNGKLVLIGGTTPKGGDSFVPNQRVEVYDPKLRAWSTLIEQLPLSVRHMRFFPWRERILCVSTQAKHTRTLQLLVIEP